MFISTSVKPLSISVCIGLLFAFILTYGFTWAGVEYFFNIKSESLGLFCFGFSLSIAILAGNLLRKSSRLLLYTRNHFSISLILSLFIIAFGGHILGDVIEFIYPSAFEGQERIINVHSILSALFIAPILEEIFFRGIIFDSILKEFSLKTALIISSILFAIMHIMPFAILATFIMGIGFGFIYYKTKSIIICILAHMTNNLFALVGFGTIIRDHLSSHSYLIFNGTVTLLVVLAVYKLYKTK